jgi:hypothetical protein
MAKDDFHELTDYIVDFFDEMKNKLNLPVDIKYTYQANDKQKDLITIKKIPDNYAFIVDADLIVTFNEDYFDAFDEESKKILTDQELAKVEFNMDKGTLKIVKPDLVTSSSIIKKYSLESVERANQVKDLYKDQQLDDAVGQLEV